MMNFLNPLPPITIGDEDYDRLLPLAEALEGVQPALGGMLLDELERAEVQPQAQLGRQVAAMHRPLLFGYGDQRQAQNGMLVYPAEADIALGRISIATPVGAALIGLAEGQSIAWRGADGEERRLTLHKVLG